MASVSSTSSLGNTSLRGYGGMASGIDRDAIIEKMTLGTTTKISNQKKKMTQLQWKQEAYRGVSDKILDWSDTYASYASSKNLKDPTIFSKNQITVHGKEDSKNLVTVTGSSDLIDTVSILGVKNTASAAVQQSKRWESTKGLEMDLGNLGKTTYSPNDYFQAGGKLIFESVNKNAEGKPTTTLELELKSSYSVKDASGKVIKEQQINYAPQTAEEYEELATALNELLKAQDNLADVAKNTRFEADGNSIKIVSDNTDFELKGNKVAEALGYDFENGGNIGLKDLKDADQGPLQLKSSSVLDSIAGQKLVFEYNGTQKSIELITSSEASGLKDMTVGSSFTQDELDAMAQKYGFDAGRWNSSSKISDIQNDLNNRLYEINSTLERPAELQKQKDGLQDIIDEMDGKISEATEEKQAVTDQLAAATDDEEKSKLQQEIDNLQSKIDGYTEEKDRLNAQMAQVTDDLQEANDALAASGASGNSVKDELEALKKSLEGDETNPGDLAKIGQSQLEKVVENVQTRLNQAFGDGSVQVSAADGKLTFKTEGAGGSASGTLSVYAGNVAVLNTLGVEYGGSNKVNLDGKLSQDALGGLLAEGEDLSKYTVDGTATGELKLKINGVDIKGLTLNSSVNDILSKINSTKDAGVKATYVESTGQFMLVSSETGKGRTIKLGGDGEHDTDSLAYKLFADPSAENDGGKDGENAQVVVSYGNGVEVTLERSSNTFNLEGLTVMVSGEFGYKEDGTLDKSAAVTFSAKADVEGALERVKAFIDDYNALVTEINNQVTTRPSSDYEPLTDEQKAEMDETSIENWENKAKQGMLYGDSAMRDLSMDVQSIITKMMSNGANYEDDLKAIGITYAEDWGDGGTLVFDESKFRAAMETDPEKVSNVFTGGGNIKKGLIDTIEETFTPYATRYAYKNGNGTGKGSYGRLIEIAGSEKKPTTLMDNEIYKQLEEMQNIIDSLNERLKTEQDRYISQFTTMETLLNQMNTQSSYLSQLSA